MIEKELKATLVKRTSKKGTDYECIMIQLTPNCEKAVFLTSAELELIKMSTGNLDKKTDVKDIFK